MKWPEAATQIAAWLTLGWIIMSIANCTGGH